jgi:glycosyltransferase involved in cell wall biosynthesis
VVPAYREEQRIAATVRAALTLPGVDLVVVVDDGSDDGTAASAAGAGADVVRSATNGGKAAAMERGADRVAELERQAGTAPRPLVFLDADLEDSAARAGPLLRPIRSGEADMTVARLPDQPGGGRGFVVRLARAGVLEATGWSPAQPLSGQRALTRAAFEAGRPLAGGWGVEVGLSIDLLRQGFGVAEVEVDLRHRVTGSDWRAQVHRGRQFWGVWRALRRRGVGPRLPLPR